MKNNMAYQSSVRWHYFVNLLIALSILNTFHLKAQVNFQQEQSITVNGLAKTALTLRNSDPNAYSELTINSDNSKRITLGVAGSSNAFFDASTNNPYLFNATDRDFYFYSSNQEDFVFHTGGEKSVEIYSLGLSILNGKYLELQSENNNRATAFQIRDNGDFRITRNGINGTSAICIAGDKKYVGINNPLPGSDLDVLQANVPNVSTIDAPADDTIGLRLNNWNIYEAFNGNLSFVSNAILRSYIVASNGNYVNSSDRRLKDNITPLENVLDRVHQLIPSRYNYLGNDDETVGLIAQDVEKIFPELVYQNGEYKALAYDNFTILAIKAIQELTDKVIQLECKLADLSK